MVKRTLTLLEAVYKRMGQAVKSIAHWGERTLNSSAFEGDIPEKRDCKKVRQSMSAAKKNPTPEGMVHTTRALNEFTVDSPITTP